jgi:uncharacterized surface protein with fasciclin (FAS1) repeats
LYKNHFSDDGGRLDDHNWRVSTISVVRCNEHTVMVGGAAMYPSKNIVQNAMNLMDHTTLVAAVKQAGLVDTLSGKGPFTVFAPTNEAFNALPDGTVDSLMKPDKKTKLKTILTYHVVPGRVTMQAIMADIKKGDGKAMLKTVEGSDLTFTESGGKINVMDSKGDTAQTTISNVGQSNGEIQVINRVLLPS